MIASVSGRRICTVGARRPARSVMTTAPPSPRIALRTASMPTPRPEMSLVVSAVEKPGVKRSSIARAMSTVSTASGGDQARARRPWRRPLAGSMPRPSSRTVMTTLPPAWRAESSSMPVGGLPAASRSAGVSRRVVERVADEVHERIAERVDDRAVELGLAAGQHELDLLAELGREVADEPREAHEDGLDRDHPHLHDHRLQRLRAAGELLHRLGQALDAGLRGERLDPGAVDDELAHVVHQLVEPLGVDADGRADRSCARR